MSNSGLLAPRPELYDAQPSACELFVDSLEARESYIDIAILGGTLSLEPRWLYEGSKRIFDCILATIIGACFLVPALIIAALIKISSKGPVLYWTRRVGRHRKLFLMAKFRTMQVRTPEVPSSELNDPLSYVTGIGRWLRKASLDEIPQLLNILKGEMSFVGPRPVILAEKELTIARSIRGVHCVLPGVTGWAQINGRDFVSIEAKAHLDGEYLKRRSLLFDFRILCKTAWKVIFRMDISH